MQEQTNIVFMGTPEYATKILKALVEAKFNIVAVFTQPDKPVGRKQILTPSSVKTYSEANLSNVPIFQPKTLRDEAAAAKISSLKPDFIVVAAYGKILPKTILDIAPCINLHASILPKFRGASPIQSAILAGEKMTGVTSMLMNEGLDTGGMLEFAYTNCEDKMAGELFDELGDMAGELIVKTLLNFKSLIPIKQDDTQSSECKKIQKSDGLFSFNESTQEIYNKFRALTPWPGIYLESGLKILSLDIKKDICIGDKIGEILQVDKDSFTVGCKDGAVSIKTLQEPSKKAVDANSYINGKRLNVGDKIL
ncbi:methionyl-tRNA formyltransferase [Campylobacter sp. RM16187]|uniref:methionyl-tRNA formyltransferase n=1 Tax=Campylobacter sp. RM16187 TaxID=1660063 RepID=UPI0021B4FB30|nr:methionyl-tRNA formyltransferase [Campylobacter sp. RM16187]QKG28625.1 10-formyltetrahydrofolate:L-methionyl-tRNA(fMet) N-formyltransferase [Campylobacter sp. RM16187]